MHPMSDEHPDGTDHPDERAPLDLLVWDAPNIDMTLSNVIGAKPSPASRPRFDAIARWFVHHAPRTGTSRAASSPTSRPPRPPACAAGSRRSARSATRCSPSPSCTRTTTSTSTCSSTSPTGPPQRRLTRLIVASGDGRNFLEPLEDLARSGVQVVVLSFSEVAGYAMESDLLTFLDLEDVPGAFVTPAGAGPAGRAAGRGRLAAAEPVDARGRRAGEPSGRRARRLGRLRGALAYSGTSRARPDREALPITETTRRAARPAARAPQPRASSHRRRGPSRTCAPPAHPARPRCCSPRRDWR